MRFRFRFILIPCATICSMFQLDLVHFTSPFSQAPLPCYHRTILCEKVPKVYLNLFTRAWQHGEVPLGCYLPLNRLKPVYYVIPKCENFQTSAPNMGHSARLPQTSPAGIRNRWIKFYVMQGSDTTDKIR